MSNSSNSRPDQPPIMTVERVSHSFDGRGGRVDALADISFKVRAKEFLCLVGPSGCGKSTLLRLMAGLLSPTTGRISLQGQPLPGPRRGIGIVFQKANLMPWRNVRDNVALPLELAGIPPTERRRQASRLVHLVGLSDFEGTLPRDLSGGMEQRVAIGRALASDPEILLMDEPFGALDAMTRERMAMELLRIWRASGKTIVMVTHNIPEALFLADRVMVLSPRPGQLKETCPVSFSRPRDPALLYNPAFARLAGELRAAIG
jgi:NitT/TauT family transport system ATP-binding protein